MPGVASGGAIVVDASVIVSALVDDGPVGRWAADLIGAHPITAPHLLHAEVTNVLRRTLRSGDVAPETTSLAHADLLALRVELFTYLPFAARIWELRTNLTAYDAWYVAVAEALEAPLATLDAKLSKAAGPTCEFLLPD